MNAGNVLYVGYNKKLIINALNKCCDHNFKQRLLKIKNPYGDSNSYKRVVSVIENIDLLDSKWLIKKKSFVKIRKILNESTKSLGQIL